MSSFRSDHLAILPVPDRFEIAIASPEPIVPFCAFVTYGEEEAVTADNKTPLWGFITSDLRGDSPVPAHLVHEQQVALSACCEGQQEIIEIVIELLLQKGALEGDELTIRLGKAKRAIAQDNVGKLYPFHRILALISKVDNQKNP